jgi:hypothetical protein
LRVLSLSPRHFDAEPGARAGLRAIRILIA